MNANEIYGYKLSKISIKTLWKLQNSRFQVEQLSDPSLWRKIIFEKLSLKFSLLEWKKTNRKKFPIDLTSLDW